MPADRRFRLVLAKEDFKFSASHFTLFGVGRAELLHGHNYRVAVELAGDELDEVGLLADIESVKERIRELCRGLDSRTLVPAESRLLDVALEGEEVEVRFGARRYRFPAADVVVLPLVNTSIELLARMLWGELAGPLQGSRVGWLAVSVEETAGQRCVYEGPLAF